MSSPSEGAQPPGHRRVTHVVVGEVRDPLLEQLISAQSGRDDVEVVHLRGEPGDGRRLLGLIAHRDQVLYWP